jgi:membrane protease subunit HflK
LLDSYAAGIRIASVEVLELVPPDVVVDAFNDVSSAQGDRETLSLAADAYASQVLPEVRGRRSELMEEARGSSTELLAKADGAISRFNALRGRYRESPQAVRMELRDALLEEKSGELNFMVVSPGTEVFLPEFSP